MAQLDVVQTSMLNDLYYNLKGNNMSTFEKDGDVHQTQDAAAEKRSARERQYLLGSLACAAALVSGIAADTGHWGECGAFAFIALFCTIATIMS